MWRGRALFTATVTAMENSTPLTGELVTRIAVLNRDAEVSDTGENDGVYTALAYQYEATDTYGTTMQRGAMAHVAPDDFRILEYHRQDRDPVGKPISVEDTPQGPVVRFVFADTPRAQELRSLVEGGFLRAVSVGFIPTDGFVRADGVTVFTRADLHELSLVNTPSSKGALIQLARDMNAEQADLETIFGELPEDEAEVVERSCECDDACDCNVPCDELEVDELTEAVERLRTLGVDEDLLQLIVRNDDPIEEEPEQELLEHDDSAERMLRNLRVLRQLRF
jgi:HK97 family phage prohead protease